MPPGMVNSSGDDWISYAYINGYQSFFNNEDCQFLSHQMQQVGHNLGLHHSGEYTGDEENQEYGDQTGYMGLTVNLDDGPAMCFNPAKSWQLGWYEDKTYEIDIMSEISNEATSLTLNGVVDYEDITADRYIVVKLLDFYIGFNRAESFNSGVQEAPNQVTIVENLGASDYPTKSKLVSKLSVGDSYRIALSDTVLIDVEYVSISDGKDAVIEIKYANEPIVCDGEFDAEIEVVISTDRYPEEISWGVADANGQFVHLANYGDLNSPGLWTTTVGGLCRGLDYYFIIMDEYRDGFCCEYAAGDDGTYGVTYEGEELFSGEGSFEYSEVVSFVLPEEIDLPEEEEKIVDCDDFPNKKFDITIEESVKTNKNCAWLASKKKSRRKEYCKTKVEANGKTKKLHKICKETCGLVGKGECAFLKDGQ
jgi:hypothetical protein